jgi:Tol biopolymer transport system component
MLRASRRRLLSALLALPLIAGLVLVPSVATHANALSRNGRIAFDDYMTGQIYAVNPDGTALVQLTHFGDGQFAVWPRWSPDGTHLAFARGMGGPPRLWIMDANGHHLHMVAKDASGMADLIPTYAPGGRRLVFTRCRPDPPGGCALFSIRTDGTHRHPLTPFHLGDVDFGASVSPDGRRITFARFNANGITSQIYVMHSDGSGTYALTAPVLEGFAPEWSPDGRRITFSSDSSRLGSNVYSVNADGSRLRHLTSSTFPNNDVQSAYAPQGNRIVFDSDRRYSDFCCSDLFVMRTNGNGETFIDTGLTGVENPAWGTAPLVDARSGAATSVGFTPAGSRTSGGDSAWCRVLPPPVRAKQGCAEVPSANTAGAVRHP